MKTKDELKIGDIVWINFETIKKDTDSYKKISKPIDVIVKEIYSYSVVLEPVNKESRIGKITCYFKAYIFYENYEEALTDLITEATEVINELKNLADKIEKDILDITE